MRGETHDPQSQWFYGPLISDLNGIAYRLSAEVPRTAIHIDGAFEAITGYPRSEYLGGRGQFPASLIHPEDIERVRSEVERLVYEREPFQVEYRLRRRDGRIRWVRDRCRPVFDESGDLRSLDGLIFDITELREAQEALREGVQRYRNVYEVTPLAFVVWEPGCRVVDWNHRAEQLFGWSREEAVGADFFDLIIPKAERQLVNDIVDKTLSERLPTRSVNENVTKGGRTIVCEWHNSLLLNEDGEVEAVISLAMDVTSQRRAEEALQDALEALSSSEQKFRLAIQSSPNALALTEIKDDRILEVNDGFERMFEYTREEAIGKTSIELGLWQNPTDREAVISALKAGKPVHRLEIGYRTKSGRPGTADISVGNIITVGDRESFLSVIQDITDQKKTEQALVASELRYRTLFESANDGILLVQGERVIDCNEKVLELLQIEREEVVGSQPWIFSPALQPDGVASAEAGPILMAKAYAGERTLVEWVYKRKDGTLLEAEVSVTRVKIGGELSLLAISRDLTARKRGEKDLRRAYAEIEALRDQLEAENIYLREEMESGAGFGNIIGESAALRATLKQIEMVAPTDSTVLILGESGTGKELVAREIHRRSARAQRTMIRVNCASIPRELYESEFFGHVKGAFTGAIKDRAGRFELAHGNTIFLDEVGEIPTEMQSKLLRVLQDGQYERVGDERTRTTDVRVIAATNRDLTQDVEQGRFREDLFYRLNVFPIQVAPLRRRKEDIPLLAMHFLAMVCQRMNRPIPRVTRANLVRLQGYNWPGNIRELQNVVERAVITYRGGVLEFDLPASAHEASTPSDGVASTGAAGDGFLTDEEMRRQDRENVLAALNRTGWRIFGADGAAALLGVKPTTLASRIKRMGLTKPE